MVIWCQESAHIVLSRWIRSSGLKDDVSWSPVIAGKFNVWCTVKYSERHVLIGL
jgi:hypothetical protein